MDHEVLGKMNKGEVFSEEMGGRLHPQGVVLRASYDTYKVVVSSLDLTCPTEVLI